MELRDFRKKSINYECLLRNFSFYKALKSLRLNSLHNQKVNKEFPYLPNSSTSLTIKMITPFSYLDHIKMRKFCRFLGNTAIFKRNEKGEWLEMKTIRWPFIFSFLTAISSLAPFMALILYAIIYKGRWLFSLFIHNTF